MGKDPAIYRLVLVELDADALGFGELVPRFGQRVGGALKGLVDFLIGGAMVAMDGAYFITCVDMRT